MVGNVTFKDVSIALGTIAIVGSVFGFCLTIKLDVLEIRGKLDLISANLAGVADDVKDVVGDSKAQQTEINNLAGRLRVLEALTK